MSNLKLDKKNKKMLICIIISSIFLSLYLFHGVIWYYDAINSNYMDYCKTFLPPLTEWFYQNCFNPGLLPYLQCDYPLCWYLLSDISYIPDIFLEFLKDFMNVWGVKM